MDPCMLCDTPLRYGVQVCRGCNCDIVYSATPRELVRAFALWMIAGTALMFAFLNKVPHDLHERIPADNYLSQAWAYGFLSGFVGVVIRWYRKRGRQRFFRARGVF
jgi:hypothetical protein